MASAILRRGAPVVRVRHRDRGRRGQQRSGDRRGVCSTSDEDGYQLLPGEPCDGRHSRVCLRLTCHSPTERIHR